MNNNNNNNNNNNIRRKGTYCLFTRKMIDNL